VLTPANKLMFLSHESVTDHWSITKSYGSDNRTTFNYEMFSSSCSLMLYAEVMNDDGQDAAVQHIEKKPTLLNTVKLTEKQKENKEQC